MIEGAEPLPQRDKDWSDYLEIFLLDFRVTVAFLVAFLVATFGALVASTFRALRLQVLPRLATSSRATGLLPITFPLAVTEKVTLPMRILVVGTVNFLSLVNMITP
jgi:uncharacterized protein involved in cysteine biosynthesis